MSPRSGVLWAAFSVLALSAAITLASPPARGADPVPQTAVGEWPQWRGPDRTGISRETGLLSSWPPAGPHLVWKTEKLGGGYSTPSVAGGRVYGMSYRGDDEVVWAVNAVTGQEVWSTRIAKANRGVGVGEGSRSTPTITGDRLYTLGVNGDLVCLETATGNLVWRKNLVSDFGGSVPGFGYCESPLVDGERVIVTPGGQSATLAALDRKTGAVLWKAAVPGGDAANYSSSIFAEVEGTRQYLQFLSGGVVGVSAEDGRFLWRYATPANKSANCSTPIYRDGCVFAASAYSTGGGAARLTKSTDGFTAQELYFTKSMQNHHGGMVLVGNHVYGFDNSNLACLDFRTGKEAWNDRSVGKGSLVCADGRLYVRSERGGVALVEASPEKYVEKGRFEPPVRSGKSTWAHPVVAGGRLYLRDQDYLLCYDLKQVMSTP